MDLLPFCHSAPWRSTSRTHTCLKSHPLLIKLGWMQHSEAWYKELSISAAVSSDKKKRGNEFNKLPGVSQSCLHFSWCKRLLSDRYWENNTFYADCLKTHTQSRCSLNAEYPSTKQNQGHFDWAAAPWNLCVYLYNNSLRDDFWGGIHLHRARTRVLQVQREAKN